MAKQITSRSENYSQWYNDLVVKADLAENSAVRGCMVIKPYGYAIWEKMQANMDYKPGAGKIFSLNISPVTASVVIVNADSLIRVKYGNDYDKLFKWELGAQLKATLQKELLKDFKVATQLTFFSDYMGKLQNIKVNWDVQLDYAFNKYLKASFRTNMIYDDNILIANKIGHECPRLQFKEVFSLNFSYTIGSFKK